MPAPSICFKSSMIHIWLLQGKLQIIKQVMGFTTIFAAICATPCGIDSIQPLHILLEEAFLLDKEPNIHNHYYNNWLHVISVILRGRILREIAVVASVGIELVIRNKQRDGIETV